MVTAASNKKSVTVASQTLTPEQRNHQKALAKIRRLNTKLTQVKLLVTDLDKAVESGKPTVTIRQVNNWSSQLKKILNMVEPDN